MVLTKRQFNILTLLEHEKTNFFDRQKICQGLNLPSEEANETLVQLTELGFIDDFSITSQGIKILEPYRVQRAIFIAAGFGSRLVPITLNTPKPLVRVKGIRIIDTMLDALNAAGIQEIIIVRGYMAEQFDQLLYKYPKIKFFENSLYNETNNISSAMCIRNQIQNAYMLDGDLVLRNHELITKYQYTSNYLGVPVDVTDDWCLETRDGIIRKMKLGGRNCYHMFGISYWSRKDGIKLAKHIKQVYEMPGGKEHYWDEVALEYFTDEYNLEIRQCTFDDIFEIDTFSELKKIDESYHTGSA
jgi:CTP:phosphocholine cytidylyltransferase-like protein